LGGKSAACIVGILMCLRVSVRGIEQKDLWPAMLVALSSPGGNGSEYEHSEQVEYHAMQ